MVRGRRERSAMSIRTRTLFEQGEWRLVYYLDASIGVDDLHIAVNHEKCDNAEPSHCPPLSSATLEPTRNVCCHCGKEMPDFIIKMRTFSLLSTRWSRPRTSI